MPRPILFFTIAVLLLSRVVVGEDDARVKAELQATFADMSRAVLAGNSDAYMAFIDPAETRLVAEQRHWMLALKEHQPVEFSLSVGDGPATFAGTAAEFPLTMAWRFENGLEHNWGMDAKGHTVKFPAVIFAKRDGHWVYKGEKWKEIFGPDGVCSIRFLPGSERAAEDALKGFPVSKAHVDTEFQHPIKEMQTVELFQSMDHLKATVFLNMPDTVLGGWSEPGESIKFMDSYTRGIEGWTAAFAHEYAHVATWELGVIQHALPWWAEEGVAELCASRFRPGYEKYLNDAHRQLAAKDKLQKWEDLSEYLTTKPALKRLAYTQGNHMVWYVTSRWKREGRNAWIKAMASGRSLDEATRQVLGIGFDELDKQWRASLTEPPAPPPPSAPEPEGIRTELQQLLSNMSTAVAAADQVGYMAHVSPADAVFFKEQQNWARDLARAPAEHIEIMLDDPAINVDSNGSAVGRLTMKWRMPSAKDRSISFPAKFIRGETGWLYAGESWNVVEGDHSKVLYEDEALKDVAEAVAGMLPEIRTHVHEGFELSQDASITERVQQVKLYTSMRHLQHSIYLSYTDGLSGWNEPDEAIKILANPGTGKSMLKMLLGHEYGHVATFHLGPKATDMPWWILEGVAELSAEEYARNGTQTDRMVKHWAKNDGLVDWDKLADFHGEAANHQAQVYTQGHHMVSFISEKFGRKGRNAWLRELAKGTGLNDATTSTLKITFAELDERWRESLVPPKEEPKEKHQE